MTPKRAEALALLLPFTLVVPLLWRDYLPATLLPRVLTATGVAALALGGVAFALGWRYFRPGYSVEPNRWGLVVGLAAMGTYFLGSVRSMVGLHWAAGGLLYLAAVIYLGGPYFAVVALPAVAAALVVVTGRAQDLLVEVPLAALLVAYIAATFRLDSPDSERTRTCAHLGRRAGIGSSYCPSCGLRLGLPSVRLGRAKVGTVLLTALAILMLALAQPVAFNVTQSGVNYTTYTAAGIHVQPFIGSLPSGWKVANVTHTTSPLGTSMAYDLSSARSNASLLVVLSSTTYHPASAVPGNFSKANPVGDVQVGGQSLVKYGLTTNGSADFTGLAFSAPLSYLSGGRVSTGVFSFLAAEPAVAYNASRGQDLVAISSSVIQRLGAPQLWSLPLATVGSNILQYDAYLIPSVALIAVVLFVGSLRGRELRDSRVVDNSFGLSTGEFSLFAVLANEAPLRTGAEYEAAAVKKGVWEGGDFSRELLRLERLSLMSMHVRVRGGVPRLLWKCELA
jgi:hypothetical protein